MTELVYESQWTKIYQGDSIAAPITGTLDLLCTDPPYGVKWRSNIRTAPFERITGDSDKDQVIRDLGVHAQRIRKHRHVYVFGFTPDQLKTSMQLGATAELIWDKQMAGLGDLRQPWGPQHEPITFGVIVRAPSEVARGTGRLSARMRQGSVLSVPRKNGTGVKRHPTEKPIALMRQLIESSSCIGDTVYDPYMGVGSTLVAAVLSGRKAIGVELDEHYVDTAIQRVKQAEKLTTEALGV